MKKALFLLLDQYAEWEASYCSSILNRSNEWDVKTVSLENNVTSIGGFTTEIDLLIDEISDYDALIMIGGNSWNIDSEKLRGFIKNAFDNEKFIGAICGAVDYLGKHGLLNNYRHTSNSEEVLKSYAEYKPRHKFSPQQAIIDGNLVTANGTAPLEFTKLILKGLQFDNEENIEKQIYMYKNGFYEYCKKYGNPY
ncbi:type 1 glutamine amidotransferase family protein [Staphylococcus pettenkoferi]|uniref:type 1 glutamine amidotransferase family protein n=1 Tax=Staphylococcus pettenkoferi TaxID=170573 RepID=UPI0011A80458|nr:type 1 glutamine amidotransferase family protein [Staphylococcus pettenkoferi]MCY1567338.1 glutamine amidotransferase [Staphylococcus pettenkoferi]MCY1588318.1 glutamine amidotransferase [Staphylococcus pettenkoferi]MDK7114782.1 type 1 glutamine amidotransferase family protein [Staphylococcus pettenkoferi]MDK7283582.1 type 1 glutamine amidotransferase family protein [Staphylococcus pettenkoferi]